MRIIMLLKLKAFPIPEEYFRYVMNLTLRGKVPGLILSKEDPARIRQTA